MEGEASEEEEDTVQIGRDSEWTRQRKEEEFGGMGVAGVTRTYTKVDGQIVTAAMRPSCSAPLSLHSLPSPALRRTRQRMTSVASAMSRGRRSRGRS